MDVTDCELEALIRLGSGQPVRASEVPLLPLHTRVPDTQALKAEVADRVLDGRSTAFIRRSDIRVARHVDDSDAH